MSLFRSLVRCNSPLSQFRSAPSPRLRRQAVRLLTPKCRKRLDCSPLGDTVRVSNLLSELRGTIRERHELSKENYLRRYTYTHHALELLIGSERDVRVEKGENSCETDDYVCIFHQVKIDIHMKILGKGAFGVVVTGNFKGEKVAVKICKKLSNCKIGEVNAINLEHPHLVRIFAVEDRVKIRLVLMEIVGERTLQNILDDSAEVISFERRLRFCCEVASGISYCHYKEILHLDLKPSNILISDDHCKLADFGCAMKLTEKYILSVIGTPNYCAPEIFKGNCPSVKSDIYSFGIIMWQLYSRQIPFSQLEVHTLIYSVVARHIRPRFPSLVDFQDSSYASLAERCWSPEETLRPTSNEIISILETF